MRRLGPPEAERPALESARSANADDNSVNLLAVNGRL